MKTNDAIALAAVIIVVLVMIYLMGQDKKKPCGHKSFISDDFQCPPKQTTPPSIFAKPQMKPSSLPSDAEFASKNPEAYLAREQAQLNNLSTSQPAMFEPEQPGNNSSYNQIGDLDFASYITDQVADSTVKSNHQKWVNEVKPWAGTAARNNDDLSEAMEASVHFVGLRRPQAVRQFNPQQVTEVDGSTFAGNKKFNFLQSP